MRDHPRHEAGLACFQFAADAGGERIGSVAMTAPSADYYALPERGDCSVEIAGTVDDWYESSCGYCGFPTAARTRCPLVLSGSHRCAYGDAGIVAAAPRDPRLTTMPWVVRRTRYVTLVREDALQRLVSAIPGVERLFRETSRRTHWELDALGDAEPVAATRDGLRYEAKLCPRAGGWSSRIDPIRSFAFDCRPRARSSCTRPRVFCVCSSDRTYIDEPWGCRRKRPIARSCSVRVRASRFVAMRSGSSSTGRSIERLPRRSHGDSARRTRRGAGWCE